MFVRYALDHDGDYYQMKNIDTGREYNNRNIAWLQRMCHVKPKEQLCTKTKLIPEVENIDTSIMEMI